MDSRAVSSLICFLIISILTTSSWAGTFYNRQPFYQNRNYNNPFNGYSNGGDFNQNPFPYPSRFQQNGFRPFPNNQFSGFGQQPFLADIYKQLFQQHRNPFLNNGNTFGLGQHNISQGFPPQGQNIQGQGFPAQGQNFQGQDFGQFSRPVEGQGQAQGQPLNNYYGPNNPNSNNRPGQENVYTHGELPASAIQGQGQGPSSPVNGQQGQNPNLTNEEKRTTAQSPTTGQRPGVLPVATDSDTATQDASNLANGQKGQNPSSSDLGKRTTAQSPTTGQRPSVLPVATDSESPVQSADIDISNSEKKGHHDQANRKPAKGQQGQNPGSTDQDKRTTGQSPTTGQRPSVLPVTDSDSPGGQKSKVQSEQKVNWESDSTQTPSKSKKPNDNDNDTFDEPSKKPPQKTQKKDGKNSETVPKLDVRGTFPKSEKQNPKSKTEATAPAWDFIEEEIIS